MDRDAVYVLSQIDGSLARRVKEDGREFLVVPVVAVREKVLRCANCHPEGEFLPASEIEESLVAWEGRPVTMDHPKQGDEFVTANSVEALRRYKVGRFHTVHMDGVALKGEMWLDTSRARHVLGGSQAVKRLEANELVEVSTAYFGDREKKKGRHEGESYAFVQRRVLPDHLAILLNDRGACSIEDGCGAPRLNREGEPGVNVRSQARVPSYSGTETTAWSGVTTSFQAYRDGYYKHTDTDPPDDPPSQVKDAPAAMRRWIASKTLLGESDADNERDLIFFPVVNPGTDQLNRGALQAVLSGRGSQADIPASARESARAVAQRLLEREFDVEPKGNQDRRSFLTGIGEKLRTLASSLISGQEEEMSHNDLRQALESAIEKAEGTSVWVVDVFDDRVVYEPYAPQGGGVGGFFERSYELGSEGEIQLGDRQEVRRITRYEPIENTSQGEDDMDPKERAELITRLAACKCVPFGEEDLKGFGDEKLTSLAALADRPDPQANAGSGGGEGGGADPSKGPEGQEPGKPSGEKPTVNLTAKDAAFLGDLRNQCGGDVKAVKELLDNAKAESERREEERKSLIEELKGNARCAIDEAGLERMDLENLRALKRSLTPSSYLGAGGPQGGPSGEEDDAPPPAPAVLLGKDPETGKED